MNVKNKITIGENDIKSTDIDILNGLMLQLNPESEKVDMKKVKEVMKFAAIITLRDGGILIGMGTLISNKKLFSFSGIIEDVVVDEKYRGRGLGKKIMQCLIKKSKSLKMKYVDLTSRPHRVNANKLYSAMGFVKRKTNVYRLTVDPVLTPH